MNKRIIISVLPVFFIFINTLQAEIPEGYYQSIHKKSNSTLKTALWRILKEHTTLKYNDMWYYFRFTDIREDGTVWDMYSNTVRTFSSGSTGSTSGMDREHCLPKSWWALSAELDKYVSYTDLNNLYPSDATANARKSNYMLGSVTNPTFDNGVSKVGPNSYSEGPARSSFEPADEYKGDFARTYLYMVTSYEDYAQQWRSDGLYMFKNDTYPVLQAWAVNMLLAWHRDDPVSQKERDRNEQVYRFQGNRNPFIDFPQLVEYIWGDSVSYTFSLPGEYLVNEPVIIFPANESEIYFGERQISQRVSVALPVKGADLTGNLSFMLFGDDVSQFELAVNTLPASVVNSESGTTLEISYVPNTYGEHTTTLIIQDGGMAGSIMVYLKGVCAMESGIIPIGAKHADMYVEMGQVFFRSYQPGDKIQIYNVVGKLIYIKKGTGEWENYIPDEPGIYFIRMNGKTRKILLK
ncbi:MAG: endonuclease [Candidatus Azobacteroides sp.]|nr:endonuclease [Candidatus Azobacteroides sp.]